MIPAGQRSNLNDVLGEISALQFYKAVKRLILGMTILEDFIGNARRPRLTGRMVVNHVFACFNHVGIITAQIERIQ